jgi:hypothetical protein
MIVAVSLGTLKLMKSNNSKVRLTILQNYVKAKEQLRLTLMVKIVLGGLRMVKSF